VVNFTPRGKSPRYPLDRRLDGPQSRSGRSGEEKILDPTGTRTPLLCCPARRQSLYRLRYTGSQELKYLSQFKYRLRYHCLLEFEYAYLMKQVFEIFFCFSLCVMKQTFHCQIPCFCSFAQKGNEVNCDIPKHLLDTVFGFCVAFDQVFKERKDVLKWMVFCVASETCYIFQKRNLLQ
jgi:hypothetical protein